MSLTHKWKMREDVNTGGILTPIRKRSLTFCTRCSVSAGAAQRFGWTDCHEPDTEPRSFGEPRYDAGGRAAAAHDLEIARRLK